MSDASGSEEHPVNQEDVRHLDLLAVFHYVVAGFSALFGCFPIPHFVVGILILAGEFPDAEGELPPMIVAMMFIAMPGLFILFGWTLAVVLLITGRRLKKRMSYCPVENFRCSALVRLRDWGEYFTS